MRNNNQQIVRKLTANTLKANKGRNIFLLIAIFLTTFMISAVFSVGASLVATVQTSRIQLMGTAAQAAMYKVSDDTLAKLPDIDYIKYYGVNYDCGSVVNMEDMKNAGFGLIYYDEISWDKLMTPAYENIKGHYPEAEDEIMIPTWILEELGITDPETGMEIRLDIQLYNSDLTETQTMTFRLSGWFTSYLHIRTLRSDMFAVSEAFAVKNNCIDEYYNGVMIEFTDSKVYQNATRLANDLKLENPEDVHVSPLYTNDDAVVTSSTIAMVVIALFLMFTGYLLIYNILYISISNDIRFYGLLKTIGMTPRQIKSTVYGQILRLCVIGIPTALIFTALISYLALPTMIRLMEMSGGGGVVVSFNPIIYIGAALFSLLTAVFSAVKPSKKAARISPVEAVKYTAVTLKKANMRRSISGNPIKTAWRNVFRIRKQAIMVFLSLFLGLTTFLCIAVIISSMDIDNYLKTYLDCDIMVTNYNSYFVLFDPNDDPDKTFPSAVLEQFENLPGLINIDIIENGHASVKYPPEMTEKYIDMVRNQDLMRFPSEEEMEGYLQNSEWFVWIYVMNKETIAKLNETLDTPIDVDAFERGEIVILQTDDKDIYEFGKEIELTFFPLTEIITVPIGGYAPRDYKNLTRGLAPNVFISNTLSEKVLGDFVSINRIDFDIEEEYQESALELIESLYGSDTEIEINSRWEMSEMMANAKLVMALLGGGLSLVLGLIGILNFVNIMFTEIFNRRREIAMLESIGQTKKQVKRMLMSEGAIYAVISAVLVLAVGTPISYGLFKLFSNQATYIIFSFPLVQLIVMFAIIFTVCLIVPLIAYKSVSKSALVERLKIE